MITMIGSGDLGYAAAAKRGVYEIHPESLSIDSHSNNLINDKNGNKKISAINGTKVTSIDKDKDKMKKNIVSPLLVPISSPIINDDVVVLTQSKINIVTPTSVTATATVSLESKTQTHIASKSIPLSENEKSIPINVLSQSQSLPIELNDSITFGNFETPIAYESEINISIFFFLLLLWYFFLSFLYLYDLFFFLLQYFLPCARLNCLIFCSILNFVSSLLFSFNF